MFSQGGRRLRVDGALHPVEEKNALATARQHQSIIVGLIPFNPDAPAQLYRPEHYSWEEEAPTQENLPLAQPQKITGLTNPNFKAAVAEAVALMNQGHLEKVVLARLLNIDYSPENPLHPAAVLNNLLVQQPRAYVFSMRLGPETYLMGASPELVFKAENGQLTTHPLAGSAPRRREESATEDAQAGEELMRSPKNRAEHATVVEDIKNRLSPLTQDLTVPAVPSLVATPQLWHLGTAMSGLLKPGISSLDGARAIHPTPAICGAPRERALELLQKLEGFDRGFFGGLVGWMDAEGNGEWALVLRCAQLSPQKATLFAGCGIVKDSRPEAEHAETATKLASFAQALGLDLEAL